MFKSPIEIDLNPNDYTCVKVKMRPLGLNSIIEVDKNTCEKEIKTTLENDLY